MRVIGPSVLACLLLLPLQAGTHEDVTEVFASTAAALAAVNVPQFMDAFDKDMSDYGKLKTSVTALVNQTEVTSAVELIKDEGDETRRTVDLDWYIQVRSLLADGPIATRREVIHCELRKEKKRWKIVSLKPIEFFAPAKLDQ